MDELGERMLGLGADGEPTQTLRLRREFAESSDFERALRIRFDEVRHLTHPSLATVHSVLRTDKTGLSLVSAHVAGKRLSAMSADDWGPAFAMNVVRTVTPVLAMLHGTGTGLAHGTLSPDRIVVDSDGRVTVVEHVLAPAIEALELSREDLNTLDLVVPADVYPVPFTLRGDMVQLGVLALSLFLGRRLDASDYPAAMPARLDEFAADTGSPYLSSKMRAWLERALQIDAHPFANAQDALDAFDVLPNEIDVQRAESKRAWLAFPSETDDDEIPAQPADAAKIEPVVVAAAPAPAPVPVPVPTPAPAPTPTLVAHPPAAVVVAAPAKTIFADSPATTVAKAPAAAVTKTPVTPVAKAPTPVVAKPPATVVAKPPATAVAKPAATTFVTTPASAVAKTPASTAAVAVAPPTTPAVTAFVRPRMGRLGRVTMWVIGGLAVLAATEAIGLWLLARPKTAADGRSITQSAAPANVVVEPPPSTVATSQGNVAAPPPDAAANTAAVSGAASAARPASAGSGRLRVSSSIELRVFMDGQLIGSSAAAITVSEGFHRFEFVNDAFDFRQMRNVTVRGGKVESVNVVLPNGRLNINATPWAEVTIDGRPAGETPLANLALPIGVHEIVFRHPQLGERRQTVVLKTGPLLRVTETFQAPVSSQAPGK
jgi:hypothetical protein